MKIVFSDVSPDQSADLNGDICADWVSLDPNLAWRIGSPAGLGDELDAGTLTLPGSTGTWSLTDFAVLRHDEFSQILVTGTNTSANVVEPNSGLHIITLSANGSEGTTTSLSLTDKVATGKQIPIAADDDLVAIGDWQHNSVLLYNAAESGALSYSTTITQDTAGIPGTDETGDDFGRTLALRDDHLAIGIPGETTSGVSQTGRVQPVLWHSPSDYTAYRSIDQNTKGVVGTNEKGDRFGGSLDIGRGLTQANSYDIIIGTPLENVGSVVDAGTVTVANFNTSTYRTYSQSTKYVPGSVARDKKFGVAVEALRMNSSDSPGMWIATKEGISNCYQDTMHTVAGKLTSTTRWKAIHRFTC